MYNNKDIKILNYFYLFKVNLAQIQTVQNVLADNVYLVCQIMGYSQEFVRNASRKAIAILHVIKQTVHFARMICVYNATLVIS